MLIDGITRWYHFSLLAIKATSSHRTLKRVAVGLAHPPSWLQDGKASDVSGSRCGRVRACDGGEFVNLVTNE